MDKIRSEALKIVNEKFTIKDIYAELDRRSRIFKEAEKNLKEIPELMDFLDLLYPEPDKQFERRFTKFYEQIR